MDQTAITIPRSAISHTTLSKKLVFIERPKSYFLGTDIPEKFANVGPDKIIARELRGTDWAVSFKLRAPPRVEYGQVITIEDFPPDVPPLFVQSADSDFGSTLVQRVEVQGHSPVPSGMQFL